MVNQIKQRINPFGYTTLGIYKYGGFGFGLLFFLASLTIGFGDKDIKMAVLTFFAACLFGVAGYIGHYGQKNCTSFD